MSCCQPSQDTNTIAIIGRQGLQYNVATASISSFFKDIEAVACGFVQWSSSAVRANPVEEKPPSWNMFCIVTLRV